MTEPELQQRLRHLCALRVAVDDLLELDEGLAEVALAIVDLADPVLRIRRERMLREPIHELA